MKRFIAIAVVAAFAPLAAGQERSGRPDPADPTAPAPPARYESPFASYVPFREQEVAPWRDVNEEVAKAGGHGGIFGGAGPAGHAAAKPAAKSSATDAAPASKPTAEAGHGAGHK